MPSALARIQFRQGPSADWVASDPVLSAGEPGVELDTLRFKIGDGTRTWRQLPYAGGTASSAPVTSVNSKTGVVQLLPADLPGLDAFIRGVVSATLQAGSNIGITALSAQGRITLSSTGSAAGISASQVSGLAQFVAENAPVRSIVGSGAITVTGTNGSYTVSGATSSVDAAQVTNLSQFVASNSPVKDIKAGANVTVSAAAGVYTVAVANASGVTSVNGASGAVSLKAGANATVATAGGVVTVSAADAVNTLNGQSGAVTLAGTDGLQVTSGATARDLLVGVAAGGTFGGTPVAPGVPVSVTAVAGDGSATVSWDAPLSGAAPTAYDVAHSSSNGTVWQLFGQTTARAIVVSGLVNGQPYVFRVRAVTAVAGAWSAASAPVTPTGTAVNPDSITVTPSSIVANNSINAVVGALAAFSGTVPLAATFAITGGANSSDFSISQGTLRAAVVLTASAGASREVAVTAKTAQGGTYTQTLSVIVVGAAQAPGAPLSLTATAGIVSASGAAVTLSWLAADDNGAAVTSYRVQVQKDGESTWTDGPSSGLQRTVRFDGLEPAALYRFRVAASNSVGDGPFATTSTTTANGVISFVSQPSDVISTDGTATFAASAVASTLATVAYQWQLLQSDGSWSNVSGATSGTLTLTGLINTANGRRYRVKASAPSCDDAFSNAVILTVRRTRWYRTVSAAASVWDADSDGTRTLALLRNGVYTTQDGTTFVAGVAPAPAPVGGWVIGSPSKGFLVHLTGSDRPGRRQFNWR